MSGRPADLAPCGLRHVSLAGPFAPIEAASGERAVYTVFWRHGRPVGFRIFLAGELPVPAAAAPPLAADTAGPIVAAEVEAAFATPPPPAVSVSVVICTRDRPEDLSRCLTSLARCVPPPSEVIAVDNAPRNEATAQVVRAFPGVRYVRADRPGLSHARNAGIEAATGEIIAFTDDDVELPEDWVARLAAPFADAEVACVTGLVIPADLSSEAACLFEFAIGGFGSGKTCLRRRFDQAYLGTPWWRPPDVWKMGAGANMAMRRSAFADVGLFDPRLGAGASGCSEDSELWFRLLRAGHTCQYDPAAVVFHHHRGDRPALFRQLRAYARGHVVALFVQFTQDRRPAHLIRAFALMPWWYLKLVFRALRTRDRDLLAIVRPQFLGWLEGPFHALVWLRRDGPPRLAPSQASGDRP